ncbi:unnamed protein product [Cylindrotheca closterium]|uniref:DUF1415 domain-containing protein n=1 Tax=Cylindrotheca closterium TaxID=2856 RepID=A0AAD2JJB6_9STRA|nr:unnamed protein product [Cylindrotheca closterium]
MIINRGISHRHFSTGDYILGESSSSSSSSSSSAANEDDEGKEDRKILEQSLDWLRRSVIGLSLCPFAEKPLMQQTLSMEVVHGSEQVEILASVLSECLRRQKRKGTSLIICPDLFPENFVAFLEITQMVEGLLDDWDLDGDLQVAHFHPKFEFDGSGDGIDNYTNRSPYPTLHILREEEVSVAVESISGDASKVWKRNVRLLETLEEKIGRPATEQVARGEFVDQEIQNQVEAILKGLKKS